MHSVMTDIQLQMEWCDGVVCNFPIKVPTDSVFMSICAQQLRLLSVSILSDHPSLLKYGQNIKIRKC